MPALLAAYACVAKSSSPPTSPSTDETLTIAPPPAARSRGIACLQQRKTLFRFVSSTVSHASSVHSSTGPSPRLRPLIPAVLTSTSMRSSSRERPRDLVAAR